MFCSFNNHIFHTINQFLISIYNINLYILLRILQAFPLFSVFFSSYSFLSLLIQHGVNFSLYKKSIANVITSSTMPLNVQYSVLTMYNGSRTGKQSLVLHTDCGSRCDYCCLFMCYIYHNNHAHISECGYRYYLQCIAKSRLILFSVFSIHPVICFVKCFVSFISPFTVTRLSYLIFTFEPCLSVFTNSGIFTFMLRM